MESVNEINLENSSWQRGLSKYLEISTRWGSYFANMWFLSLIGYFFDQTSTFRVISYVVYFLYSVLSYRVVNYFVNHRYKPKFVLQDNTKKINHLQQGQLVLQPKDYHYRVRMEKLIYTNAIYFLINFTIAILIYNTGHLGKPYDNQLVMGGLAAFCQVFNFVGIAIISGITSDITKKHPVSSAFLVLYALIFSIFLIPLAVYIISGLYFSFMGDYFPAFLEQWGL